MAFAFQAVRSRHSGVDGYAIISSEKAGKDRRGVKITFSDECMHDFGLKIGSRVMIGFDSETGLYGVIDNSIVGRGVKILPTDSRTNSLKESGNVVRGYAKQAIIDPSILPEPKKRMIFSPTSVANIDGVIVFDSTE